MSNWKSRARIIIALAYFHRYGSFAIVLLCSAIRTELFLWFLSVDCIIFSIWTFVGYKLKWRHIYCSYQNACHQEMTPHSVCWDKIKKSDAYGVPLIFFFLGLVLLIVILAN